MGFYEKSRAAYNRKADGYDHSREGQFTRGFQRLLMAEMTWKAHQSVLDVACGNGSFLASMNRRKPIRGFGIDIAERMIELAAAGNPGMVFRVAGCEAIPFPDESMDIITVSAAYHHFPDTAAFASEARRVLKPKGMVYIAEIYLPAIIRFMVNPFVPLLKDGDVRFYSPGEIAGTLRWAGFEEAMVKISGQIQIVSMGKG